MGVLGDKLLAAGLVTEADAARVRRQQTIEREQQRKAEEAAKRVELREYRKQDRLARSRATAEMIVGNAMLLHAILQGNRKGGEA